MLIHFLFVFIISLLLTRLIRYYAVARNVLDIPNQRSSHSTPTARGGGLAIVLVFYSACVYLFLTAQISSAWFYSFSATLLVAVIGFCDDHTPIASRWRFLTHLCSAFLALYFFNGLPLLLIPEPFASLLGSSTLIMGWLSYIPLVIALVWILNLFNFMDGTDGIAASEAVFVSAALAAYLLNIDTSLFMVSISLTAAALGFLIWNWPKASIFMGDVGSGFLGLVLGILILLASQQLAVLLYCGLILFGLFIVDASYTLLVRIKTGQKWYSAHCSHTYQRVAKLHGHLTVLKMCWAINLLWLLPISWLVFLHPTAALLGIFIAYLPLFAIAHHFKAGQAASTHEI
ncbi:glycosyltransferase family 4 protein [Methylomonas sp. AM2-LC]|uniref:MraY family glycosyltransferase n=1 Tax=Methylomonas sp. AM2-LC TaxID=3153301 RepID=UPI0032642180